MDRVLGSTFYLMFTTRAFATGIPTTLAGTPVVSAYENEGLTQITAGVAVGVDHDSVSGLNLLTIIATGANGFESGKDYNLVITTGTVSSVSVVGEVVGSFSLSLSAAAVDLANATDGLGAIKTDTAATLVDTGTTLPASLATIDTNVDAILVDTDTTLPASLAVIDTNVDSILVDTGTTLPASIATVDTNVDSILVDTAEIGTAGAGLTAIMTTQMTESYAADGVSPTPAQALFIIQANLSEFSFSGTTQTVNQLDGSTQAATYTLNSSALPTSKTRAS